VSAHGLCYCAACADMARRIANAVAADEVHRLTEPELRRAAGEAALCHCRGCVMSSGCDLRAATLGVPFYADIYARERIAALLRAIVQQELVDRLVAWLEAEVTP
jgi:hypothetical protein